METLRNGLEGILPNRRLTDEQWKRLENHFRLLKEWNANINLVSPNSLLSAHAVHYADSIEIADFGMRFRERLNLIDLGSGAGFPGLITAVLYPNVPIALYEKLEKKRKFLLTVIEALHLSNVSVQPGFVESKTPSLILARAVFPMEKLFKVFRSFPRRSRWILNLGGQTPFPSVPKDFQVLETSKYSLGEKNGDRQVAAVEFVPRGT